MKKTLASVLALVLCLGLCACGNGGAPVDNQTELDNNSNAQNEILGKWTFFDYGFTVTFFENGTGTDGDGGTFTWKYDEDLKYYTIAVQTEEGVSTFDTMIQKTKHPAVTYITIYGERFYHLAKNNLKGCKVITVVSKDMAPTINDGDTVLCKSIKNPAELSVGDIIAYWTVVDGQRVAYASRIKNIYNYDGATGELIFETQDDNNENANPLTVHQSEILGEFIQVLS